MEPWPAESTKRSRSGHVGSLASYLRYFVNRTVAMSAAPSGRPGCPDFACSTASMASARTAFARSEWETRSGEAGSDTDIDPETRSFGRAAPRDGRFVKL